MNIKPDLNQNIIISATGEFQIKLLTLIYANINDNFKQSFKFDDFKPSERNLNNFYKVIDLNIKSYSRDNVRFEVLYFPTLNKWIDNKGTIWTRKRIKDYYNRFTELTYKPTFKGEVYLESIASKIDFRLYRLINMKEFLDLYGKYLFYSKEDALNFISRYENTELSKCNIFKTIKSLNYG